MVTFEDFKKMDLRVAKIKEVREHPNADKLYILILETGEGDRQVVAGIKDFYSPEDLVGKKVIAIVNLATAMIRGAESQGMVLAAKDDKTLSILIPGKDVAVGTRVS